MDLKNFSHEAADWRKIIRHNKRRTDFVIASFVIIYMLLGLLIDLYLNARHYPHASLAQIFDALVHFNIVPLASFLLGGIALVAILVTITLHDRLMLLGTDYREITPESAHSMQERQLYNVVEEMKISAGLHFMPKVYLIEADYMNALASGYSEKSAMVAITRGLITKLNRAELQAVMAHELSHIRHLDIKLTLMATVLANITLIVIDLLFNVSFLSGTGRSNEDRGRGSLVIVIYLLRFILPLITILLIFYLSRSREYMADAGCVELMRDNQPLASALLKIYNDHAANTERYTADYQQTPHESVRREAYIFDPKQAGILNMQSLSDVLSTHPSIAKRLAALGFKDRIQS